MIKVKVNEKEIEINDKTTYYELAKSVNTDKVPYLVKINRDVKELRRTPKNGEDIQFLYYKDQMAKDAYARTAILIMLKAIHDVYSDADAALKFKVQNAYYFEIKGRTLDAEGAKLIMEQYDKIVKSESLIKKIEYSKTEASKILAENQMDDVKLLFDFIYKPTIKLRYIDDYVRYINGELLYHTGMVKYYKIKSHKKGLLLFISTTDDESEVVERAIGEKQFDTLNASTNWARKLGINTVGVLNSHIATDTFDDLVIMTESYQDKQIGDIAELFKQTKKKLIFIAGPSSSGKTSFANRLAYHLKAIDLKPHLIACDNFFKEREDTPKDENGEYDFESILAMDTELLNSSIQKLLNGEKVEMPRFNFARGVKEYNGNFLQLNENDVLILEGIHCLNPALVPHIDQNDIFKVYVSALTEVSIDNANRIATSDLRLIRRLIRDIHLRRISPKDTILRWKSVRNGEEKSIFPYQERADIFFNSALIYEFSVIKDKAIAKLFIIADDPEVGMTARRLIKILNFFLGVDSIAIPAHSILREFLGNSILEVV
ncbi:MAG: nucleoside kinase [Lachnospiraceae bacterium]|nr:nucleoside kinase [Lachnospiraceae bacterium]